MIKHRFMPNDIVNVDARCGYPAGTLTATISSLSPYRGRPGYYVAWNYGRDRKEWETSGGWMMESVLTKQEDTRP